MTEADGTNGNKDERIFFAGQRISDLDKLEKLKARYEKRHFCKLWKGDVRTYQAAAKRAPKIDPICKPSLKYYSLKLVWKFGGRERKRTKRI